MVSAIKQNCTLCGRMATKSCSRCKGAFYCSVAVSKRSPLLLHITSLCRLFYLLRSYFPANDPDSPSPSSPQCQKKDWKRHKKLCTPATVEVPNLPPPPPPTAQAPPAPPADAMGALRDTFDLLNPKLDAAPTPLSRAELYKQNPELRQLRDKVDDCIELVNDGNDALYTSPAKAEGKLRAATNLASSLLTSIAKHKPPPHTTPTPLQQVVMSLFFDITHTLTHALTSLGSLKEMTGSAREALVMYQTALPQCEAHEDHSTAFTCRVGIGNCYKATGQLQKAIDVLALELEFARTQRDEIGEAIVCCSLSKCYGSLPFNRETFEGNMEKALAYAERDVVLSAKHSSDYPAQLGAAHCQLASCLRKGGDHKKAKEFFDSAVQLLQEGDDQPSRLMALIEYATMVLTEGGGHDLPPSGPPTLALAHSLAMEALSQSKALKDKDNAVISM